MGNNLGLRAVLADGDGDGDGDGNGNGDGDGVQPSPCADPAAQQGRR